MMLPKPTRADRLVRNSERTKARRSSPIRNPSQLANPKLHVWHCAQYRAWARKRYHCAIHDDPTHVCGPWVNGRIVLVFAHPESAGRGLKASDYLGIVLCSKAHATQHRIGWSAFQLLYRFDRDGANDPIPTTPASPGPQESGGKICPKGHGEFSGNIFCPTCMDAEPRGRK
jgi:hypothetical protein